MINRLMTWNCPLDFLQKVLDFTRNARNIQVVDTPQPRLGTQGLEQKMTAITKKQIRAFMAAHYPDARHHAASCSWKIGKSYLPAMSEADALAAAKAEIELWKDGIALKPSWVDA